MFDNVLQEVILTRKEEKVIRKIAKVQIRSIVQIIAQNSEVDITLFCLNEGIDLKQMMKEAKADLKLYTKIYEQPNLFFELSGDNMVIAKHIMWNFTNKPKYDEGRRGVWRKLLCLEIIPISLQ